MFGSHNIHARIIFPSWQRAKVVQKQMILRTDHIERPAAKGAKVKNSATCVVGCVRRNPSQHLAYSALSKKILSKFEMILSKFVFLGDVTLCHECTLSAF